MTNISPCRFYFSPKSVSISVFSPEVPEDIVPAGRHLLLISWPSSGSRGPGVLRIEEKGLG